jgi:hypothetical protein
VQHELGGAGTAARGEELACRLAPGVLVRDELDAGRRRDELAQPREQPRPVSFPAQVVALFDPGERPAEILFDRGDAVVAGEAFGRRDGDAKAVEARPGLRRAVRVGEQQLHVLGRVRKLAPGEPGGELGGGRLREPVVTAQHHDTGPSPDVACGEGGEEGRADGVVVLLEQALTRGRRERVPAHVPFPSNRLDPPRARVDATHEGATLAQRQAASSQEREAHQPPTSGVSFTKRMSESAASSSS